MFDHPKEWTEDAIFMFLAAPIPIDTVRYSGVAAKPTHVSA